MEDKTNPQQNDPGQNDAKACPFLPPVPQKDALNRVTLNLHPCIKSVCGLWNGEACGMRGPKV